MSSFQLFKSAIFQPKELLASRKQPFWKAVLYFLAITVVLAIPFTINIVHTLQTVKKDGEKIVKKLPEFSIKKHQLTAEKPNSGFIYQTDSFIFTFDPEGKRSLSDLENDLVGSLVSVGLLKDSLVLALPDSGAVDSMMESNIIEIPYEKDFFSDLNKASVKKVVNSINQSPMSWLMILLFSLYPVFLNTLINLLLCTLAVSIFKRLRPVKLTFMEDLKITIYSATLPTILVTLLQLLVPSFSESGVTTLFILLTMFIHNQVVNPALPPNISKK